MTFFSFLIFGAVPLLSLRRVRGCRRQQLRHCLGVACVLTALSLLSWARSAASTEQELARAGLGPAQRRHRGGRLLPHWLPAVQDRGRHPRMMLSPSTDAAAIALARQQQLAMVHALCATTPATRLPLLPDAMAAAASAWRACAVRCAPFSVRRSLASAAAASMGARRVARHAAQLPRVAVVPQLQPRTRLCSAAASSAPYTYLVVSKVGGAGNVGMIQVRRRPRGAATRRASMQLASSLLGPCSAHVQLNRPKASMRLRRLSAMARALADLTTTRPSAPLSSRAGRDGWQRPASGVHADRPFAASMRLLPLSSGAPAAGADIKEMKDLTASETLSKLPGALTAVSRAASPSSRRSTAALGGGCELA